ncbi:MAG: hypothetical protein AAF195_01975 [Pseudomonadota bacterium]
MQVQYQQIDDETISIFIPVQIKKRGGAAMIILPKNTTKNNTTNYDDKLTNAFAKAYKWQQILKNDKNMTIAHLADKENVAPSYCSKILRLNYVAPDIISAILNGKQPRSLKLQDFMIKPIPHLWQEQKEMFGF